VTEPETPQQDGPQGNSVYRQLLDEIRCGQLNSGDRLRETELAERLAVSRTPIREAIRQLESDGIVVHVPRQGATIRILDYSEVMELYEMRAVLEGTAARLAAQAASEIEIEELEVLNQELKEAGNSAEAQLLNRQFHAAIMDAAKNRFLVGAAITLQKTLMILGPTTLSQADRAEKATEEHLGILDAIKVRDGKLAEAAMRSHIENAQRVRVRTLRSRPYFDEGLL